jgi:hypothetical protein
MVDTQALRQQFVLRQHHIVIIVLRKMHAHAVAWLARFSMADVVGNDDEIAAGIQGLAGAEQYVGELRARNWRLDLLVPWRMSTALVTRPLASRTGLPKVR